MSSNLSIAVLPFVNMSSNQENEYFCDGITEEIINALAKIDNLYVTSRTSSFYYKGKNKSIKLIGDELNVSTVLEGSVRLSKDVMRITAQLIQAEEDFHFWSKTWDRKLENIFEIQDEVSLSIADKLREQFGHLEIDDSLVHKQTESLDAYEHYLKGRFYQSTWGAQEALVAIKHFENALKCDPNHVPSMVGLAEAYSFLGQTGSVAFDEGWAKAINYAEQALAIDDQSPEAHYFHGSISFFTKSDFGLAIEHTSQSLFLNPNFVDALNFMSFLQILAGNKEKSVQFITQAKTIDPKSNETLFFGAYVNYMLGNYDKSLEDLNACLEANPGNIPAHAIMCDCLLKLKRYDEVLKYFDNLPPGMAVPGAETGYKGLANALKNDKINAELYLEKLKIEANEPEGFGDSAFIFLVHAALGNNDPAFEWVEKAIEQKNGLLLYRYSDPLADALREDLRYAKFHGIIYGDNGFEIKVQPKKQLLDTISASKYADKLINHIDVNKPYLDTDLSLRSLAKQIEIHPNQLSWLLNNIIGKSFSQFINRYRVEEFKKIAKDPQNNHLTLVSLAYDSGFNSKTVFNTYFKRETGLTPKQFLKG